MENPLNNFQQKPKLEENEVEKREKRIKTIEIEVDGQIHSLETESYDFEYPEGIQKETGILGYERTKISDEDIMNVTKNIHKVDKEYNFNRFITEKLLPLLSDNEYPDKSFNHRYGWYHGNPETKSRHKDYFKKDFFLGKIYDLEKIKEESKYKKYPFSSAETTDGDYSSYHANISIYDQENDMRITNEKRLPLGNVLDFENQIKEGKAYATTTYAGLNLISGGFFGSGTRPGTPTFKEEICLGFSFKLDNFMREYYEKTFCIYAKQVEDNQETIGALVDVALFLLFNKNGQNIQPDTYVWEGMTEEDIDFLNSILEQSIARKLTDTEVKKIDERYEDIRGNLSSVGFGVIESKLPIFIGHKDLPQLSWGHATYANYMNEKGLNFFKFKHADHLPKN